MKINLETQFYSENGDVIQNEDKTPVTAGELITRALLTPLAGDDKMDGQEKADLFNLWFDHIKDNKECDVKVEQVVIIKERVGKAFPQLIVGQVYKLL